MTVMRAVKMDFLHRCIRLFERFVQRFSRRGHAQHAAAVRQQLAVSSFVPAWYTVTPSA